MNEMNRMTAVATKENTKEWKGMHEMSMEDTWNAKGTNVRSRTRLSWKRALLVGVVACTLALPTMASAEEMMAKQVDYSGIQTMMKDGTELVPLRQVAESLGFKVTWQDATRSIVLTKMMMGDMGDKKMDDKGMMGDKHMMMGSTFVIQIDSMTIQDGGMAGMLMYAPMLINSMTYVPKAFVDTYLLK
ncbi:stalk domain-containing protein [Paenibacillus pectinilyticus]|nr:stalk domain-containing protein [Paenibacillus pectinilyticus]